MEDLETSQPYLTDLSPKDKPWDEHKATAVTVRSIYWRAEYTRYAERMQTCAELLEFGLVDFEGEKRFKLRSARFCRVRLCPICQWRRSLKWKSKLFRAMPKIIEKYPKHRWLLVTLTVQNCAVTELKNTIAIINKAFILFSKRKQFPGVGWIKSTEVTRGKDGSAHPHFHVLMLVPPKYFSRGYMRTEKWAELWQSCLGVAYTPIVDVTAIKSKSGTDSVSITGAVCEVLKYSVKESDLTADPNWLLEVTKQLHNTRAVGVGGCLRDFLREESDDEDLIHVDPENEEELSKSDYSFLFGWREKSKKYKLI